MASEAVAVTQIIPAGEDVSGGDVHTVVTQQVYGTTRNFTVSGNQQIMSGGKSYNSVIYPYGQQNVEAGGVSYNTNVAYDALQNVNGTALFVNRCHPRYHRCQQRRLCAGYRRQRRHFYHFSRRQCKGNGIARRP